MFPDSGDWSLSSANSDQFTVECWAYFDTFTAPSNRLVGQSFGPGNLSWQFETSGTLGEFAFRSSSDGTTLNVNVVSSGAGLAAGAWYHLAVGGCGR